MGKKDREEEPPELLQPAYRLGNLFWLGAGMGFLLSTLSVIAAVEFSSRRRRRTATGEEYDYDDSDLVHGLTAAVTSGIDLLAQAAREVSSSFADARRELIRSGLEGGGGGSAEGFYFDEEEAEPAPVSPADYEEPAVPTE